jgi:hypothetical protein
MGILKSIGWYWLFCGLGILACGLYTALDNSGWIPHNHDTPVWIQGDWMVGEYRTCLMLTTTPVAGTVQTQELKAALPRLLCGHESGSDSAGTFAEFVEAMPDMNSAKNAVWGGGGWSAFDSYFHVLPVRYNGRINRPDKWFISWRCQRNSESLTCKALD